MLNLCQFIGELMLVEKDRRKTGGHLGCQGWLLICVYCMLNILPWFPSAVRQCRDQYRGWGWGAVPTNLDRLYQRANKQHLIMDPYGKTLNQTPTAKQIAVNSLKHLMRLNESPLILNTEL